eukprot:767737-Hanusia_phi.AAC.3
MARRDDLHQDIVSCFPRRCHGKIDLKPRLAQHIPMALKPPAVGSELCKQPRREQDLSML